MAGVTVAGYILVFGDLGYLSQAHAESNLAELRNRIAALEMENRQLSGEYARLQESSAASNNAFSAGGTASRPETQLPAAASATILKFEAGAGVPGDSAGTARGRGFDAFGAPTAGQPLAGPLSLSEARALFLCGMLFFALLGYYAITRLGRVRDWLAHAGIEADDSIA